MSDTHEVQILPTSGLCGIGNGIQIEQVLFERKISRRVIQNPPNFSSSIECQIDNHSKSDYFRFIILVESFAH